VTRTPPLTRASAAAEPPARSRVRRLRSLPAAGLLLIVLPLAVIANAAEPPQPPPPLLIEGGTVLTMAGPPLPDGKVLIGEGKIRAVGPSIEAPAGARRLVATGMTVLPGLIDGLSCLYLPAQELSEPQAIAAELRVTDGADLFTKHAAQLLAEGVTALYVAPGRRGSLAGLSALARVAPAPGAIAWVRDVVAVRGQIGIPAGDATSSLERLGGYVAIREALLSAQDYLLRQEAYQRALKRWERKRDEAKKKGEGGAPFKDKRPDKPPTEPGQETLLRVLKGDLPLHVEAHRVPDILNALRLQDEFAVKLVLLGCSEGYKVAAEIARRNVPVIVSPVSLSLVAPSPITYGDHSRANAARLAAAGVKVALGVGGDEGLQSRFVRACAAMAVAGGLDPKLALEAVTVRAAETLGVADRLGSLVAGKDADVIIVAGDPLDVRAPVAFVIQGGRVVYERGAGR
jgi:imidazolonepropionase-like amidohydrolase